MDLDKIKDRLVTSCNNLNNPHEILDDIQNTYCKNEIQGEDYKIIDNEYRIFGEYRNDKFKFYYDLLRKVKKQLFNDYNNNNLDISAIANNKDILEDISDKLEQKLINKYKNKEHSHYDLLLDHYNKIDNNRKNNLNTLEHINTQNQKISIENSKLEASKYTITLTIFIILLLISIILIIIILKI